MGIENRLPGEDEPGSSDSAVLEKGQEEKPKKEIKDAENLDELCEILAEKKELVGSHNKVYSAQEDLIPAIQGVKRIVDKLAEKTDAPYPQIIGALFSKEEDVRKAFTRTGGLRGKVEKLLKKYAEEVVRENALKMLKFEEPEGHKE